MSNSQKAGWIPAIAATLLIFLVAMDQVMMPIATSAIVADLNTNVGMVQAALSLVSLVAAPLYITGGKLGDIMGKKKVFVIGLILYGIGALAGTLAPSVIILIGGWSVVRALGMVLAIPASIGLLIASYPDEGQRGQAFALYGVGAVAAALVGPLLMGISSEALSWRVPFGIEAAIAVATILLARTMTETEKIEGAAVDWGGTVLAFFAIAAIILGSMLGGRYGWWQARRPFDLGGIPFTPFGLSPAPILIGVGAILAAILLSRNGRMEERAAQGQGQQPLFSLRLFDNRTFSAAWLMATLGFVMAGALPFLIPVFVQQAVGFDGLQTALTMMAFSIGSIILGFASGTLIQRMQARTLMQVFIIVTAVGLAWLALVANTNLTLWQMILPMFLTGCGWGVVSAQVPNVQLATLSPDLQGEASGFSETGKELGIGLGTAVIASIMFSLAMGGFVDRVATATDLSLSAEQRAAVIVQLEDQSFPQEAAQQIAQQVPNLEQLSKDAYVEGFQLALGVMVLILIGSLIIASFIPQVGSEQVTAEETKEAVADVSAKRL